jgi:hypothetical protein
LYKLVPLLLAGLCAALAPAHAITVSKLNVRNTFTRSDNQRVYIYGLPPVILSSATSAYVTRQYNSLSATPYPYATSSNTLAKFGFSTTGTFIENSQYAISTISTVNPDAGLSIAYWRWFNGGTSLGSVADPSIYRRKGPSGVNSAGQAFVSADITVSNTGRGTDVVEEQFQGALPRYVSTLRYPDFSVGLRLQSLSREAQVEHEQNISVLATKNVNPDSTGALPASSALVRNASNDPVPAGFPQFVQLNNGQSAAGPDSTTNPVAPRVIDPSDPSLIPTAAQPATAVVLSSTPGTGPSGVLIDPLDPNSPTPPDIQSAHRWLAGVTLHPGATLTFRVRVLLGAAHILDDPGADFRFLFLLRSRETSVIEGVETTSALITLAADYPETLNLLSTVSNPSLGTFGPRDRQEWAHLVNLYNRSLRLKSPVGP